MAGFKEDACARVNPVVIDGKTIMLESQTKYWQNPNKKFEFEFNYLLTPKQKIEKTDTLRKGSIIKMHAMTTERSLVQCVLHWAEWWIQECS